MKHIFKYIAVYFLVAFFAPNHVVFGQSILIDSLKNELNSVDQQSTLYVDLLNQLAFEYLKTKPSDVYQYTNEAIAISTSIGYNKGKFMAIVRKGDVLLNLGLHEQALQEYYRALQIDIGSYYLGKMTIYNNIAEAYKRERQFDSARYYFQLSINVAQEQIKDENLIPSVIISNIAELFLMFDMPDSAKYYFDRSFSLALAKNNLRDRSFALSGQSDLALYKNDLYKAAKLQKEALQYREQIQEKRAIILSLFKLGNIHKQLANYDSADLYLQQAEILARSTDYKELLQDIYIAQADLNEAIGNHKKANSFLRAYQKIDKELQHQNFTNRISTINSLISAEIKDRELHILQTEKLAKTKAEYLSNMIIFLIVFLLLTLSFVLFQYYKRLKIQKQNNGQLKQLNQIISLKNLQIEEINQQLNERLMETARMLAEGQRITKLGSWEYHLNTHQLNWTQETSRQLGITYSSGLPSLSLLRSLIGEENFEHLITKAKESIKIKKPVDYLLEYHQPDIKQTKFVKIIITPIVKGEIVESLVGSNLDITEQILNEQKEKIIIDTLLRLSRESSLREMIFERFLEKILISSAEILHVERASFWLFVPERRSIVCIKQLINGEFDDAYQPELYEAEYPEYFKALHNSRTIPAHNAHTDSRTSEFSAIYLKPYRIQSMLDGQVIKDGQLLGVICMEKVDVFKQWTYSDQRFIGSICNIISAAYSSYQNKKLEKEKIRLIDRLVKKNKNLQDFAFLISHHLRGPVTQIMGLSNPELTTTEQEVMKEFLPRIQDSAVQLDKVIRDLAVVVEFHSEKDLNYELIDFNAVLKDIKLKFAKTIYEKEAVILEQIAPGIKLKSNPYYIEHILSALISNSLHYQKPNTPPSIIITIQEIDVNLVITVSDNGLGLDMTKYKNKLFSMYQRFHLNIPGRGLSLYIVKNQVELLGGQIQVESAPMAGSVFKIILPASIIEQPFERVLQTKRTSKKTI